MNAAQQVRGALAFGARQTGDRLVQQHQLRILHQQHADLEPLLLAVRQHTRPRRRPSAQLDEFAGCRPSVGATAFTGGRSKRNPPSPELPAHSRFSRTLRLEKIAGVWNLRPSPR